MKLYYLYTVRKHLNNSGFGTVEKVNMYDGKFISYCTHVVNYAGLDH